MNTIELTYRYSELDKMYEVGCDEGNPMFWFEFGICLSKSKVKHLVNKCEDECLQVFPYSFDFAKDIKKKKIKGEDCEDLAKKATNFIEKYILNKTK